MSPEQAVHEWACDECGQRFMASTKAVQDAVVQHREEDGRYCPSPGPCGKEVQP